MHNPAVILCNFALQHVERESLPARVKIYRAVACVLGDEQRSASLLKLAEELESIERRHRQLRLDLGDDRGGQDGGAA